MKKFLLEKIYLLSQKEKAAREIEFHPKTNLIIGVNHTGKSTLIKNIFKTLGASPQGKLKNWDESAITLVQFYSRGKRYKALLNMGYRGLFDENDELLLVTGDHETWSNKFAEVTGFNLLVTKKDLDVVVADPGCFFLPFYIDQDGSWQSGWDTFPSSKRFRAPVKAILEYFAGIKSFEWYQYDSQKSRAQQLLADLRNEKKYLDRAMIRVEKALPTSGPKVNPENFNIEVKQLTEEVSKLNSQQEDLKKELVKEQELINSIKAQINLSQDALNTYEGDTKYLGREREKLVCPTCDAEHDENFLSLFNYAEDARVLKSIILELMTDLDKIKNRHQATLIDKNKLEGRYRKISSILEEKKGDMLFRDVVNSMSAEHAFQAFAGEIEEIDVQINGQTLEIEHLNDKLDELTDRQHSKKILNKYRENYATALYSLNLPSIDMKRQKLTSRPDLSGSGGPRQILAYYSALWKTAIEFNDFVMPIVIDSPNQQGQDHINLPKVLKFVSNKLPTDAQLIIGSEVDTDHHFDKKITLDKPYQLLNKYEYEHIDRYISDLTQSMLSQLEESRG